MVSVNSAIILQCNGTIKNRSSLRWNRNNKKFSFYYRACGCFCSMFTHIRIASHQYFFGTIFTLQTPEHVKITLSTEFNTGKCFRIRRNTYALHIIIFHQAENLYIMRESSNKFFVSHVCIHIKSQLQSSNSLLNLPEEL